MARRSWIKNRAIFWILSQLSEFYSRTLSNSSVTVNPYTSKALRGCWRARHVRVYFVHRDGYGHHESRLFGTVWTARRVCVCLPSHCLFLDDMFVLSSINCFIQCQKRATANTLWRKEICFRRETRMWVATFNEQRLNLYPKRNNDNPLLIRSELSKLRAQTDIGYYKHENIVMSDACGTLWERRDAAETRVSRCSRNSILSLYCDQVRVNVVLTVQSRHMSKVRHHVQIGSQRTVFKIWIHLYTSKKQHHEIFN